MVSIDSIIWMSGVSVFSVGGLIFAGYATEDFWDISPWAFLVAVYAILLWPIVLAVALAAAVCYLPYRGGKALAAAADRRHLRKAVEKRERIAALHDLRSQYPRDSLTWKVINDSIHEL